MIGLSFLAAFMVYFIVCAIIITVVVKWAKKKDKSPLKWGIGAAIVMYHLVFWDFIPTMVVYKYYCVTKAGFWVYKTPDQWKAENPGVAETLTWRVRREKYIAPGIMNGYKLNERVVLIIKDTESFIIPVGVTEESIIDLKNNEKLIEQVSVWAKYGGSKEFLRFWTTWPTHDPKNKDFIEYKHKYTILGRKVK